MNCFNCGRKIALYMAGTDDIEDKPHCGVCREYERGIAKDKAKIEHLMEDRLRVQHMDMYFEENKPAMDMFIKWLRQNPYPAKEESNGN